MITVDARSKAKEFDQYLREKGVLANYPESYAKDHNYRDEGFGFIQNEQDIDAFLADLDAAPTWHSHGDGSCTKAHVIRNYLASEDHYNWGIVKRFKVSAAHARRVDCGCHETGSFHPLVP